MIKTGYSILVLLVLWSCTRPATPQQAPITLADPTIFFHQDTYYLYGTGGSSNTGFFVYTSADLVNWSGPAGKNDGYALKKGDVFGDKGFWAPQVFEHGGKFYMAYTANEQIAIAVSDSPLGPFRQERKDSLSGPGKQIDPYVFRDDDGSLYMYHVRLTAGNRIYVAKMKPDLSDVDTATAREVLHAEPGWENTWNAEWPVAEGPTVLKHKGKYYLIYSANDFRNPDYAVGYAVSDHPMGPWIKQEQSPIISRSNIGIKGTGHGDILQLPNGEMKYVMHTHRDSSTVAPRLTGIVDIRFQSGDDFDSIVAEPSSFRYLTTPQFVFTNPLLPSGADPFSIYKDGYYYYTHTLANRLSVWKVKNITDLPFAKENVVFTPPADAPYSKHMWAPEINYIAGKWYIYFAASDGDMGKQRMYVVENSSPDPTTQNWILKGQVADATDKWAIDGNVFEWEGRLYMLWSGWEGDENTQQNIYIAPMSDPWTISGERVCISKPELEWEKHGKLTDAKGERIVLVNEGPQSLIRKDKLMVIYSASGCWTDHYALGMLRLKGGDLLNPADWEKNAQPVFEGSAADGIYAPGHNSFFKSPDGKEDWILYHANDKPGQGCGGMRSPRAQPFSWKADGAPDFGKPVKRDQPLPAPAG